MTDMEEETIISIGKAAKILGKTPQTLRNWESENGPLLPCSKPNGRRMYKLSDVTRAQLMLYGRKSDKINIVIYTRSIPGHGNKNELKFRMQKITNKIKEEVPTHNILSSFIELGTEYSERPQLIKAIEYSIRSNVNELWLYSNNDLTIGNIDAVEFLLNTYGIGIRVVEEHESSRIVTESITSLIRFKSKEDVHKLQRLL